MVHRHQRTNQSIREVTVVKRGTRELAHQFKLLFAGLFLVAGLLCSQTASFAQAVKSDHEFRSVAAGVEHLQITRPATATDGPAGPWLINVLRVDLKQAKLKFVRAMDQGVGLETVSSLVTRHGAKAGINAGYFRTTGVYRGESVGSFVTNGRLLSEPHNNRVAVALHEAGGMTELIFGFPVFQGRVSIRGLSHAVSGLNRPVGDNELVVFTPEFHRTTLTSPEVLEIVVRRNRVELIADRRGSHAIPADGFVIAATGEARQWLLKHIRRGMPLSVSLALTTTGSDRRLVEAQNLIGGGPQLVKDGKVSITSSEEKITAAFMNDRHPRTAIAKLASGQVLLLTVDGRQPGVSVGISLPALAELLIELGATEAINLDGGGSTTMVLLGKIVNKPSDQGGERPVSDAILVFPNP